MKETDFDKIMEAIDMLVEPMEPVDWSLLMTLPDETYGAARKLANYRGDNLAIHFNQKGRIFLFKEKPS